MNIPSNSILGYQVSNINLDEAIEFIDLFIESRIPCQVTAMNANKVYLADKVPELKQIIHSSKLVIPEQAFVIAGNLLGKPLKSRVSGIELMEQILEIGSYKKYRIFLLGAQADVVSRLATLCKIKHDCNIVGFASGYFDEASEINIVKAIAKAKADILFVAMGSPKQEIWIRKFQSKLGIPVCIGVGGSFNHIVGDKKIAPDWMRCGLEWIYRTIEEPRLWKR